MEGKRFRIVGIIDQNCVTIMSNMVQNNEPLNLSSSTLKSYGSAMGGKGPPRVAESDLIAVSILKTKQAKLVVMRILVSMACGISVT